MGKLGGTQLMTKGRRVDSVELTEITK